MTVSPSQLPVQKQLLLTVSLFYLPVQNPSLLTVFLSHLRLQKQSLWLFHYFTYLSTNYRCRQFHRLNYLSTNHSCWLILCLTYLSTDCRCWWLSVSLLDQDVVRIVHVCILAKTRTSPMSIPTAALSDLLVPRMESRSLRALINASTPRRAPPSSSRKTQASATCTTLCLPWRRDWFLLQTLPTFVSCQVSVCLWSIHI